MGIVSGMVQSSSPAESESELTIYTYGTLPAQTGQGAVHLLDNGDALVDAVVDGVNVRLPYSFAREGGTQYTFEWMSSGGVDAVLRAGGSSPAGASWVLDTPSAITVSESGVSVSGYVLINVPQENSSDGFLLVAIPAQEPPAGVYACEVYCSVKIGDFVYELRLIISDGKARLGTYNNPLSVGEVDVVADRPIFARVYGSGTLGAVVSSTESPHRAIWVKPSGQSAESYSAAFGAINYGAGGPYGTPMIWKLLGLVKRIAP